MGNTCVRNKSPILVTCCRVPLFDRAPSRRRNWDLSDGRESCALELRCAGGNVGSKSSSSCWEVMRPLCSISVVSLHCLLSRPGCCSGCFFFQVQPGCWVHRVVKGARKAAEAVPAKVSSRAKRRCSGRSPADTVPRIMLRIRGSAATRAPRCAGRPTSTDLCNRYLIGRR